MFSLHAGTVTAAFVLLLLILIQLVFATILSLI
jgi:hypothetical protein